jgi:hypothetical protein
MSTLLWMNKKSYIVFVSCLLTGVASYVLLQLIAPIHSHIPIPIWAIAEIIMAFIIPGITVLSRKSVRNVENVN